MPDFLFINRLSDIGFNAQAYTWFHFLFVLLTFVGIFLVSKYAHPKISRKTKLTFLITVLVVMFLGEIYKEYDYYRHGLRGIQVINEFPWITFPWQFCDTPVYILFLVLVIPSERFKKIGFTYLQIFGFIAGVAVMVSPGEAYTNRLVVLIQTMVHHGLMIVLSAFISKVKLAGKFKEFIGASIILLSFIAVAFIFNLVFHDMSNGVINNFYINPKIPTVYPLLDKIQNISYILFLITYIIIFLGLGLGFYYLFEHYEVLKEKVVSFFKRKRTKEKITLFIFMLFIIVSVFSKYLIINSFFFPTVSFYKLPFKLVLNGFFGNLIASLTVGLITYLIFKNIKHRYIVLSIFLLITSIVMYIQIVYAKYYNTLFHYNQIYITKNPAGELMGTQSLRQLKDLFIFMQFLIFLPPIIYFLLSRYVVKHSLISNTKPLKRKRTFNLIYAQTLTLIMIIFLGLMSYGMPIQAENINHNNEDFLYGVQSSGFYNYYFWKFTKIDQISIQKLTKEEVKLELEKHSKNKDTYINIFGETIIKNFNTNEIRNVSLTEDLQNKEIIGLFKDKNLITVQLETVPMFLVEIALNHPEFKDKNLFPNLRLLLSESYQFNNFYDNVGAGHTNDAEFSAMSGLYSRGYDTIYWEYDKKNFNIDFSLPVVFKNAGYENITVNGDVKEFYNIGVINKELYKVDHDYFHNSKNDYHEKYNASQALKGKRDFDGNKLTITKKKLEGLLDYAMVNWLREITEDAKEPYYIRAHTVHPHTPFPNVYDKLKFPSRYKLTEEGAGLFDYISYIDAYFGEFIKLSKKNKNTVYLFFGDHGPTGYYPSDLEVLYDKKLTNIQYRQHLNKTLAFLYVPDDNNLNENNLKKGKMVGYQELLRSQVDIYRTIVELFDLEVNYYYFGVNLFSNEHTYAINPKSNLIIYADDFIIDPTRYGTIDFVVWLSDNKDYDIERIYNNVSKLKIFFDDNVITPKKFELLDKEE